MRFPWRCLVAACVIALPGVGVADGEDGYAFAFEAGSPSAPLGAQFKPMSSAVQLAGTTSGPKNGRDHRTGALRFGPPGADARRFVVSRTKAGEAYDLMLIDVDGDGSLDDETPIDAKLQSSGATIWSTFFVTLRVNHGTAQKPDVQEHPVRTYLAVAGKTATPDALHYTSRGFRLGRVEIAGAAYHVVLTDRNNDGRYDLSDAWTMRSTEAKGAPQVGDASRVRDGIEAGGQTWYLALAGTAGRRARIVKDAAQAGARPAKGGDAPATPLADQPLEFTEGLEAGRAQALKIQGPLFVSFESGSSGASLDMREKVYGAASVVAAAPGLTCARVDVDAKREYRVQFEIEKLPTGILLDPDGTEVARFDGFLPAQDFVRFLAAVHSWLLPADEEPKLKGKNRKRHKTEVKKRVAYLEDNSHQGLLIDRIKDLGTQKQRAPRDALIKFASNRKSKEYITASFFALAAIGGRVGIEFLCGPKALRSRDFLVAQEAAYALGVAKDARAVDPMLKVLLKKGTKIEVVSACCFALGRCAPKEPRVIEQIFAHAKHPKDTIRSGAAEALGFLRSDEGVARLKELLQGDKNTRVRGAAAWGVGRTGRTELIPLLRKAIAEDKAHTVRTNALEAIRWLQGEEPPVRR